jgi:16S rRNA (guanine527-N7)-methyltransferase
MTESDIQPIQWQQWEIACQPLEVSVTDAQQAQLAVFYQLLVEANKTTNLTRLTTPEDFLYRHLLDSLSIVPLIPPESRLVDVGAGAGFPAIPLAVVRPDISVTAVESVGKKCRFIEETAQKLSLSNLTVLNARSEDLGRDPKHRERYDIAIARAVAALPVLLELCIPFVKPEGMFLAMKGLSYQTELDTAANALKALNVELEDVLQFEHPALEGSRVLLFSKTAPTPKAYPRQAGIPAKKPL